MTGEIPISKKIAIYLPGFHGGGAERVNINLANELVSRGYAVDIIVQKNEGVLLSEISQGVRIINLNAPRIRNSLIPLVRYLKDEKPAVLIANMWPLTVIAVLAKYISFVNTRVFVVEHATWSRSELITSAFKRSKISMSMKLAFHYADDIVAVSDGAADDLSSFASIDRKRITTIYNPIVGPKQPIELINDNHLRWLDGEGLRVLAVGTLKTIKDIATLLRSFAILRKRMDVRLLILGEGECRSQLVELANNLKIAEYVEMPGFVTNTAAYYHHADLFVLSSLSEALPTVLIEALNAGTPVVSTDCPSGPREILEDGKYGILTPVGDAEALASAMLKSLNSTHDKEALKARSQDFTIAKASDKYLALLFPEIDGL